MNSFSTISKCLKLVWESMFLPSDRIICSIFDLVINLEQPSRYCCFAVSYNHGYYFNFCKDEKNDAHWTLLKLIFIKTIAIIIIIVRRRIRRINSKLNLISSIFSFFVFIIIFHSTPRCLVSFVFNAICSQRSEAFCTSKQHQLLLL